jgi:hypothetical protein
MGSHIWLEGLVELTLKGHSTAALSDLEITLLSWFSAITNDAQRPMLRDSQYRALFALARTVFEGRFL